jgi:cell division transport system permease protein
VANLPGNPLPDAFEVRAHDGADIRAIGESLRTPALPGVEKVTDGGEVSDRVVTAARVLSSAFLIATIVLLISSALLIANTIRLSIFSRRREIEVMKLVGATNWFVRGPFMLEGLICGVLGSVAAVLLLLIGKAVVLERIPNWFDGVEAWPFPTIAAIVVLVGLTVGAIGSGITLRRFLQV